MALPDFDLITVTYDAFAADPDLTAASGTVTFTLDSDRDDTVLPSTSGDVSIRPVVGYIGADGQLRRDNAAGAVGVQLIGNDPAFKLLTMVYKATFELTTQVGEPVTRKKIRFNVNPGDTAISLHEWAPVPGARTTGVVRGDEGPAGPGITTVVVNGDGDVQFYSGATPVGGPLSLDVTETTVAQPLVFDPVDGWPARPVPGEPFVWSGGAYPTDHPPLDVPGDVWWPASGVPATPAALTDLDTDVTGAELDALKAKVDGIETAADVTDFSNVSSSIAGATMTDVGAPASGDQVLLRDVSAANGFRYALFSTFGGGGSLPSQTGNNGKFLKTNGTTASWDTPAGGGFGDQVFIPPPTLTPSGGAAGWGLPGFVLLATSTVTLSSNTDTYLPFIVENPDGIVVTDIGLNKTTAPAAGTLRWAIYEATAAGQPHASNAPIYASGSLTITAATGTLIESGLSINLPRGVYLLAVNPSTAVVARSGQAGALKLPDDLSNAVTRSMSVARTHAAFPTPGTAWTAQSGNSAGVFLKWTEN